MSDTNSFLDAMERRTRSHRDEEDASLGDEASLIGGADDDGTGIKWKFTAENPPPSIDKGTGEEEEDDDEDDDDEVVAIQPPAGPKGDDDEEFSDDSSGAGSDDDSPKAKPAKKSRSKAVKKSSKASAEAPKPAAAKQRIKWAKLVQEEVYEDGTTKTLYPFVEKPKYYLDELAAQVVIEEAPHLAGYGKGKEAWLRAAIKLRRQQDPTGKFALPTITPKKLKARFDAWMSFVPIYRAKANRDSGTDDEISGNPVLDAIETMYDEKEAGAAVASGKRAADAKKTANDKAGAEYIKCKAAGVPVPKEVVALLDDTSPEEESSDGSKALVFQSGLKKKRRVSTVSALTASTQKGSKATATAASKCADELAQLGSAATIRAEAKLIEAKNKAEALKIKRMQLELLTQEKKARIEAREKAREEDRKFKQSMSDWFARQAAKEAAEDAAKENATNKE